MMLAASFWAGCWEFLTRHPGILLVLIGVAGEIVCDWKKEGFRDKLKTVFAVLLVLGLAIEILEAAKSDKEVADTKKLTALVESNNLVLRSNVLALEIKLKDRTITPIQKEQIRRCFDAAENKGVLFVSADFGNSEAVQFGNEIRNLAKELKFDTKPYQYSATENNNQVPMYIGQPGVFLIVKDWEKPPPWTRAIVNCFSNAGITISALDTQQIWCPSNAIVIWVGRKP